MKKTFLFLFFVGLCLQNTYAQLVVTAIDDVIYDMAGEPFRDGKWYPWGKHEGVLENGTTQFAGYDWYEGARPGSWMYPGITSGQYKGINTWGQLYPEKDYIKNGGTLNFRTQIRNLRVYALREGVWNLIINTPNPDVNSGWSNYTYGFAGTTKTSNARKETDNGGGISITLSNNSIIHWWDDKWPRTPMPFDAEAVVSYAEIRLIHDTDPTVNLDNVKVLASQGIDTYTSVTAVSAGEPVTSAGLPRHKYVTSEWKSFTMYVVGNPAPKTYEAYRDLILNNPYPPFVGGYPTGAIIAPLNNSSFIEGENIKVETSANDTEGVVSKVEFFLNNEIVGVDSVAPYELIIENLQKGSYEISSVIYDDENNKFYTPSVKFKVTASLPPIVTVISPTNGSIFNQQPVDVSISAEGSDNDGTISKIEFFANNSLLGSVTSEPYTYTWTNVPEGIHEIFVVAHDDSETTSTSDVVTITVGDCGNGNSYIANPEFDFSTAGWGLWNNSGNKSTQKIDGNSLLSGSNSVNIAVTETNELSNIILYKKFNFVKGRTYKICFMAKSDSPRQIKVALQEKDPGWTERWSQMIDVDTLAQSFGPFFYKSTENYNNGDIKFHVGGEIGQVWIDKVMVVDENEIVLSSPKIQIVEPSNQSIFQIGKTIGIGTTVEDDLGVVHKVAFYNGDVLLGVDSLAPFKYFWENAPEGNYQIKAIATNDNNLQTTSEIISISVSNTNGIEIINRNPFTIYPNPVNQDFFTITSQYDGGQAEVGIYNVLGKKVYCLKIPSNKPQIVNADCLGGRGLFFVRLVAGGQTYTDKIIVQQ